MYKTKAKTHRQFPYKVKHSFREPF